VRVALHGAAQTEGEGRRGEISCDARGVGLRQPLLDKKGSGIPDLMRYDCALDGVVLLGLQYAAIRRKYQLAGNRNTTACAL
jgi:hypothetical protein